MKAGGYDLGKVAMVFGMLAFQLHILTMTVCQYLLVGPTMEMYHQNPRNNVIQAFLIIAYLLFIFSALLLLILSYSNLKGNKCISVFTAFMLFFAASSVIVGVAVFDSSTYWHSNLATSTAFPYTRDFSSYTTTTYVTGAASGYISCVILLVSLCV